MEGAPPAAATASAHSRDEADRLVLHLITTHTESLLRVARRYSYCADDAQDAYQRALEILLRHAHRLDRDRAAGWIHTVVKHEALEVRRQRGRLVGMEEVDLDRLEERTAESPEERVIGIERVARTAEALGRVKPDEARALWLKASGESYASIGEKLAWSYTKVNRCLAEGRKSFLEHFEGHRGGGELRALAPGADARSSTARPTPTRSWRPARTCATARPAARRSATCAWPTGPWRSCCPWAAARPPRPASTSTWTPGLTDGPHGVLGRLGDALSAFLHERAAAATVRLQSTLDLAANHKVAAVAASAAAMAGGGVAVEQAHPELGQPRPAVQARRRLARPHGGPPAVRRGRAPRDDRERRTPRRVDRRAGRSRRARPRPATRRAARRRRRPRRPPSRSSTRSSHRARHLRPHGDHRAGRGHVAACPPRTSTANGPDPNAEFGFEAP